MSAPPLAGIWDDDVETNLGGRRRRWINGIEHFPVGRREMADGGSETVWSMFPPSPTEICRRATVFWLPWRSG